VSVLGVTGVMSNPINPNVYMFKSTTQYNGQVIDAVSWTSTTEPDRTQSRPPRISVPFVWHEEESQAVNFDKMGRRLSSAGDLYRHAAPNGGLCLIRQDGSSQTIAKGADLAPVIADRVNDLAVCLNGRQKKSSISTTDLTTMLASEAFLSPFRVIDRVTDVPLFMPDFSLTRPGYNDGGVSYRYFYTGSEPSVSHSLELTNAFLNVMHFATPSDRANALAAALTVMLRNHWPGGKPIILATATKSHSGKDTILDFAAGDTKKRSVSYEMADWALQKAIVAQLKAESDVALIVVENVRVNGNNLIASAIVERLATDKEPVMFSPGLGNALPIRNELVIGISTNFGAVSEDILNRSLSIHLSPAGRVADLESPIGNPRLHYLPTNREGIAAELRGMIVKWANAEMPQDSSVKHSFSEWAAVVGGILKVNGIDGFLGNALARRGADDPVRAAIALLGASVPDTWLRPDDLVAHASKQGVVSDLIPKGSRENLVAMTRGIGVTLSKYRDETFQAKNDTETLTLQLETARRRFEGEEPHKRYRFMVIDRAQLSEHD